MNASGWTEWRKSSYSAENGQCVEVAWRKSSYSADNGHCVEVSRSLGAVRDSKNPDGPALRGDLAALLGVVRAGGAQWPRDH